MSDPIKVRIPSRGITVSFPANAKPEEIEEVLKRDFPRNGQDVAYDLAQDPRFVEKMGRDDYLMLRQYEEEQPSKPVGEIAHEALSQLGEAASGAAREVAALATPGANVPFSPEFLASNPSPARIALAPVEAVARGVGSGLAQFGALGVRALENAANIVGGLNDPALNSYDRYLRSTGKKDTPETKKEWESKVDQAFESFKTKTRATVYANEPIESSPMPGTSDLVSYAVDVPGVSAAVAAAKGAGNISARAVGGATRGLGNAARVVTEPMANLAERIAKSESAGVRLIDQVLSIPTATIRGVDDAARAMQVAGANLADAPTRLGPLESLGASPNAKRIDKALAAVGRYGGDDVIMGTLTGASGVLEGAVIGGALGGLADGREGLIGGAAVGGVLGGVGATAGQAYYKLSGQARTDAALADLNRFRANLDEGTRAKFDAIVDRDGLNAAVTVMDGLGILRGQFRDADVELLTGTEFAERFGANARGVQIVQGEKPIVAINVDKPRGDYTFGHEMFHALEQVEQLRPQVERIKQELVGAWITNPDGTVTQGKAGLLTPEQIEIAHKQYTRKLAASGADARAWYEAKTIEQKAQQVASELGAEYMAKLVTGSNPDSLLRGFDGIGRQIADHLLINSSNERLRGIAERLGTGTRPVESIIFGRLEEASPAVNAALRDVVRARKAMAERIELTDRSDRGLVVKPRDLSNPAAAELAIKAGVAVRDSSGAVRMRSDDEMAKLEERDAEAFRTVIKNTVVADPTKPHLRVVDDKITGSGIAPEQLAAFLADPNLSNKVKESLGLVAESLSNLNGGKGANVLWIEYGPALGKKKDRLTGKWVNRYSSGIRLGQREVAPFALEFNQGDVPYIRAVDVSKLLAKAGDRASRGNLGPYGRDFDGFASDAVRYFENISDPNGVRTVELPGMTPERATFLNEFFGSQEKGGSEFVRSFRLDRITEARLTNTRVAASELAWQRRKVNWMPAEQVGDGSVIKSPEGYSIINKGGKYHLYTPDGRRIIFDTQAQAEAKAEKMANSALSLTEWKRRVGPEDRKAIIEAEKKIADAARQNPEALRLEVQRDANGKPKIALLEDADGNPVLDEKGRPKRGVVFTKERYALRDAPGLSADDAKAVQQGADKLEANARTAMADPAIANGLGWYSRMRSLFQSVFGADIEIFGQLLGATSARTPVDINFRQALEALRLFSSGAYDGLVQKYHQHVTQVKADAASGRLFEEWKKANPTKRDSAFVLADEVRKRINDFDEVPLRSSGAKYNANSKKVLQVLYGNWVANTQGPKTPNFAGNLTGRTLAATIDVWAARNLRRLLYSGQRTKWRLLPEQESGVDFTINKDGVYGGDFVFAQRIYEEAARRLNMNPDDLQALMWFAEKDVWEKNGWTNTVGAEKSSFDKEAGKLATDRFQAGVTTFKDKKTFSKPAHEAARQRLQSTLAKNPDLVAARVTASAGLYDRTIEPSFDVEFSVKRGSVPLDAIAEVIRLGKESDQTDVFISKVVDREHPNARPGMEIGFKKPASLSDIRLVLRSFREAGIDGFTVARDRRGNVIGIRTQYVPEISGRWDPSHLDFDTVLQRAHEWGKNARKAKEALSSPNISYATETFFSTNVFGRGEYDAPVDGSVLQRDARAELGRRKQLLERERLLRERQAAGAAERGGSQAARGDDAGPAEPAVNFQPDAQLVPAGGSLLGDLAGKRLKPRHLYIFGNDWGGRSSPVQSSEAVSLDGISVKQAIRLARQDGMAPQVIVETDDSGKPLKVHSLDGSQAHDIGTPEAEYAAGDVHAHDRHLLRRITSAVEGSDFATASRLVDDKVEKLKQKQARYSDYIDSASADASKATEMFSKTGSMVGIDNRFPNTERGLNDYVSVLRNNANHFQRIREEIGQEIQKWQALVPQKADVNFQPEPENLPHGKVWRSESGFSIVQKDGGKFRVYSPIGLLGIASSFEKARQLANKRLQ